MLLPVSVDNKFTVNSIALPADFMISPSLECLRGLILDMYISSAVVKVFCS